MNNPPKMAFFHRPVGEAYVTQKHPEDDYRGVTTFTAWVKVPSEPWDEKSPGWLTITTPSPRGFCVSVDSKDG